ncbi:MAG: YicC family protein [Ichthyobacteriaceae bacterium]|nr:YicC family protein [Ichthyobacteriaceae bacterium]
MILSMTGFGKAVSQLPTKKLTVEVKTLNSKQLDLNVRVPSVYRAKELDIRSLASKSIMRGKVELNLFVEVTGDDSPYTVNKEIINGYINGLKGIYDGADETEYLKMAVKFPDTVKTERKELDNDEWKEVVTIVKLALSELNDYRKTEGVSLFNELSLRVLNIADLLKEVPKYEEERVNTVRERIAKSIDDLKLNIDQNRFEQEMIFYIEKLDVTEEKVRLDHHLKYFLEEIESGESNGKKLGFISQEIGREINTLGSKSNHSQLQRIVVQMKDELEKIKEQVLNVL